MEAIEIGRHNLINLPEMGLAPDPNIIRWLVHTIDTVRNLESEVYLVDVINRNSAAESMYLQDNVALKAEIQGPISKDPC